ncbi:hypothetical protein, partial [Novosphingobium sp.]|uniref:hypothetical protein n=1 Tax=Novosphingobium sp. TaxID=1874826 RepID=UPI00333E6362
MFEFARFLPACGQPLARVLQQAQLERVQAALTNSSQTLKAAYGFAEIKTCVSAHAPIAALYQRAVKLTHGGDSQAAD